MCVSRFNVIMTIMGGQLTRVEEINLLPFHSVRENLQYGRNPISWDMLYNMVMFVPFGIIYCYYQKHFRVYKAVGMSCLTTWAFLYSFVVCHRGGNRSAGRLYLRVDAHWPCHRTAACTLWRTEQSILALLQTQGTRLLFLQKKGFRRQMRKPFLRRRIVNISFSFRRGSYRWPPRPSCGRG